MPTEFTCINDVALPVKSPTVYIRYTDESIPKTTGRYIPKITG